MPRLRSRTSTAESGSRLQTAPEPIESARIVAIGGIHRHKRNRKKSAQEPLTGGPAQTRSQIEAIESVREFAGQARLSSGEPSSLAVYARN